MHVLSIVYAPVWGGPQNRVANVARDLAPHGVRTTVLLPEEGTDSIRRMRERGTVDVVAMPLHRMRATRDPAVHREYLSALRREVPAIADLVRDLGVDVVDTNSLPNLHGGLAARRADVACVWELIESNSPLPFRVGFAPLVLTLADVVMSTGVKIAAAHPGVTRLGDRWVTFFPSVDLDVFRPDAALRAQARAELGFGPDDVVIGNVANINPAKGHRWFLRAAADVRRTHPHARFVILGGTHEGHERFYADLWAERDALGLGDDVLTVVDPGPRVNVLAQGFDVFWLTSEPRSEGIPNAIGEAKGLQLPVVATDVGSVSEAVTDGISGIVVPPRDPAAIADATRPLLDDPALRARLGRAGRQEALTQYASHVGAEAHRLAFERAVAHHAARRRRTG